jgi:ERCC4-type nuclease
VHYAGGRVMSKSPLIIDTNERGPLHDAVIRAAEREGFSVKKEHLQGMGDYKAGNAHIECKSISDLIQSTFKGHLQRQIENLDANCDRVVLLVHGDIAKYVAMCKNQGRPTSYPKVLDMMLGIFARLTADFDCHIYRAKDYTEAGIFIAKLHAKMNKPASKHGAKAITRVSTNDVRADMLVTIPGFGPDLVDKLLEKCGSIEEMLFPESLKQVRGLGTTLRQRLLNVLTSEEPIRIQKTYNKRGKGNDGTQSR